MKKIAISMVIAGSLLAQDYNSSPYNYRNSENAYDNSPYKYENSPNNYRNQDHYGNDRIIRDNEGNAEGYAVPKQDGGVNFFDMQGNRKGYLPANR
jgi:hypothetical protein